MMKIPVLYWFLPLALEVLEESVFAVYNYSNFVEDCSDLLVWHYSFADFGNIRARAVYN